MPNAVLRRVAVHDRYQLELKLGYPLNPDKATRYRIDTYFFAPHSLGISPTTYSLAEFYRDIQHYMRMKTPRLLLAEVATAPMSPLCRSEELLAHSAHPLDAQAETTLNDNLRMLRAIIKNASEEHIAPLAAVRSGPSANLAMRFDATVESLLSHLAAIMARYRALEPLLLAAGASTALRNAHQLTDESISVLVEDTLLRVHQLAERWLAPAQCHAWRERLVSRVRIEIEHRRAMGYPSVHDGIADDDYLLRLSALKKFTSSVLWLTTSTRREGTTLEQVLFATAAGVSMIFATLIAFFAQAYYGQFTAPVFLALVIAYMFKDRIKDIGRLVSARLLQRRLYDYRTVVQTSDGRRTLGQVREKVVHVEPTLLPATVVAARRAGAAELEVTGDPESVIQYTKLVEMRRDAAAELSMGGLPIVAIDDIMRFDVHPFLRKMDDPIQQRLALVGGTVRRVDFHRTYHVNLVSVFQDEDGGANYERTRLVLDRDGIQCIEQYDAQGALGQIPESTGRSDALADVEMAG